MDESPVFLCDEQQEGNRVSDDKAPKGNKGRKIQKDSAYGGVGCSYCLKNSYGLNAFQDQDEQSTNHGETGNCYHQ